MNLDDLQRELTQAFEGEAAGLLTQATQALMELEAAATAEERNALFARLGRGLHTLKGSGATCGLMDIADLAHKLEDRLAPFKSGLAPLPSGEADLLLKSLDVMRQRIRAHARGHGGKLVNIASALPDIYGREDGPATAQARPAEAPPVDDPGSSLTSWTVNESHILGLLQDLERLREHQLSLRDQRQALTQLAQALRAGRHEESLTRLGLAVSAASHDLENVATLVELLEDRLRTIHSLPTGSLQEPLARATRDASRLTGKQVRLALLGGEIAVDKRLVESLRGALLHLVRNAVDHGIEAPEVRDAAGKHREGVVTVRFEQEGNLLRVEVSDDGGGVDPEKLRAAAAKRGLKPAGQLAAMDEKALLELIFESGFSSKDDVTQLSGRGIGLDVVRAQVRSLRGSVELSSKVGQGTRFLLTLPLEIGATPLMMVRAGTQVLAMPVASVESVVDAGRSTLGADGRPGLEFRGQRLDIADLGAMLGLRSAGAPEQGQSILVIQSGGLRRGVLVDGVDGDTELVVLPLPEELGLGAHSPYAGASLYLGAELVLVLKGEWVLSRSLDSPAHPTRRALVVDDSLTARAMHRAALESGGFAVLASASGAQGLKMLAKNRVDVVICDIQMEGMDGFEFTRRLRADASTGNPPVILVSVSDSEEDRAQGSKAGANAFLSKRECASGRLLQVVDSLKRA
jgi:chemotaxis protein histidine kinase CheA